MKFSTSLAAAAFVSTSLFLAPGLAEAATISGTVDAQWKHNHGGVIFEDTFKWGLPYSSLYLDDGDFSQELTGGLNHVELMSIDWHNATSLTKSEVSVNAKIDLDFSLPGTGGGIEKVSFNISNTPDFETCGWFCIEYDPQDDKSVLSLFAPPLDFGGLPLKLDDVTRVVGYYLKQTGDGDYGNGHWFNPEHGNSTLTLYAKVEVVPLPAAGWLLLAGLGGLAAYGRRKRAA